MSKENMLGSALVEVAGPLKDFAEKLGGEEGTEWLAAFKRFLRKEEPWPKFPIWKTINLCTGLKAADDFRKAITSAGMKIGKWANDILGRPEFAVATEETEIDLVVVSVAELGFKGGVIRQDIFKRALALGLELCPNEVGPQLRLQYKDQPKGEWLLIGMEPITDSDGNLKVFNVEHDDNGLWLRSEYVSPVHFWDGDDRLVFARRKVSS